MKEKKKCTARRLHMLKDGAVDQREERGNS
jgi:hypothetical protein